MNSLDVFFSICSTKGVSSDLLYDDLFYNEIKELFDGLSITVGELEYAYERSSKYKLSIWKVIKEDANMIALYTFLFDKRKIDFSFVKEQVYDGSRLVSFYHKEIQLMECLKVKQMDYHASFPEQSFPSQKKNELSSNYLHHTMVQKNIFPNHTFEIKKYHEGTVTRDSILWLYKNQKMKNRLSVYSGCLKATAKLLYLCFEDELINEQQIAMQNFKRVRN